MLSDYMAVAENEIINVPRLQAYLANVGSPFTTGSDICGCDTLTAAMLPPSGQETPPYTTPAADPAPWYDVDQPESADFLGFLPLRIDGLSDNTRTRSVTNTVGGGGVFGPQREQPRTITVSGLIIGASCCGSEYGLHYITEALAGCNGGCDGDCVTMYNCCPDTTMTKAAFEAAHKRTYRRAALVSGPTVVNRVGSGSGTCARGTCGANGDIIEIEFTIVAASPTAWTEPTPLLDVALPIGGTGACVTWCVSPCPGGNCKFAPCTSDVNCANDPLKPVVAPPTPTVPTASFCIPLLSEQACYSINLANRPQWSSDVPIMTVYAGSSDLRNVRVTIYEKPAGTTQTCAQIADANRCKPLMDFVILYIPATSTITLDGQTGRATIDCGGDCQPAANVFGSADGGPVAFAEMTCAEYCVCLETSIGEPPAADAHFSMSVSGKGY